MKVINQDSLGQRCFTLLSRSFWCSSSQMYLAVEVVLLLSSQAEDGGVGPSDGEKCF